MISARVDWSKSTAGRCHFRESVKKGINAAFVNFYIIIYFYHLYLMIQRGSTFPFYCNFRYFRQVFIFVKLRICEVL